jgi:hypothetical protein
MQGLKKGEMMQRNTSVTLGEHFGVLLLKNRARAF